MQLAKLIPIALLRLARLITGANAITKMYARPHGISFFNLDTTWKDQSNEEECARQAVSFKMETRNYIVSESNPRIEGHR